MNTKGRQGRVGAVHAAVLGGERNNVLAITLSTLSSLQFAFSQQRCCAFVLITCWFFLLFYCRLSCTQHGVPGPGPRAAVAEYTTRYSRFFMLSPANSAKSCLNGPYSMCVCVRTPEAEPYGDIGTYRTITRVAEFCS